MLDVELVDSEAADALRPFLTQLQAEYGMEVLVSDDQDSYKTLADDLGLAHSICRAHVNRNVARIVAELAEGALRARTPLPPGVQSDFEQVLTDLEYLHELIALRPADGATQLNRFLHRYQAAPPPAKGAKASHWFDQRLASLRWSNQWQCLIFDLQWNRRHVNAPAARRLDGTNNVAERAIGCWIKERCRTMRTFKRTASVRNLAQLIPFLATTTNQPSLATVLAA